MSTKENRSDDSKLRTYTPQSPISKPLYLLLSIFIDVYKYRELAWLLFSRDLKSQFRQSYLGYLWLILPIISTTLIWIFLEDSAIIKIAPTTLPYPVFVLIGTLIWTTFTFAVNTPLSSFQAGQSVFMKLNIPPETFILSGIYKLFFDILLRTLILIPACLLYNISFVPGIPLIFLTLGATVLLGTAIGLLILPLGALYHDVSRFVSLLLGFAMYLTPIVYPVPTSGLAASIAKANPLTPFVSASRELFISGHFTDSALLLITTSLSVVLIAFSLVVLRAVFPHLTERMGM
jgi:lipopolysaccharide transport system permease protein